MSPSHQGGGRRRPLFAAVSSALTANPARTLMAGYAGYILLGFALLLLPVSQERPVGAIDALFIATSAVSTTGLATIDTASSFTGFGEGVVLALIQLGGLGYMTLGSFVYLAISDRLSGVRLRTARAAFGLTGAANVGQFLRAVVTYTLAVETVGAIALWAIFAAHGVENPLWQAVFHAVSAFCTAGFSLFPDSLERFRGDLGVNAVISALSILGALGFLIVVDLWRRAKGQQAELSFSSVVILRVTPALIVGGAAFLWLFDPALHSLPQSERVLAALFQSMTASTSVGFNTVPISGLSVPALLILLFLMVVGASPAGTGGGLKTTTLAVLTGLVRTVLRGQGRVVVFGRVIGQDRLRLAAAALCYYLALLGVALVALALLDPGQQFLPLLFEAVSAISTIGLSMGITGAQGDAAKAVLILLMFAGRLGVITFGIALALRPRDAEPARQGQIAL